MKNKVNLMRRVVFSSLLSAAVLVGGCSNENEKKTESEFSDVAPQFSSVVVFGDSLSDNGNIKYLTEQFAGDSSPILSRSVPISPKDDKSGYYEGRFSNGEVWSNRFVKALDLKIESAQTCFNNGSNSSCNYAIAGSTTSANITSDSDPFQDMKKIFSNADVEKILESFKIPQHIGVKEMVDAYLGLSSPDETTLNHTLYVVWAGGNDYFAGADTETTTNNLVASIKSIVDHNPTDAKRYFLVPNLPDIGKTPYGLAHPGLKLSNKVKEHNKLLASKLESQFTNNDAYKNKVAIISVDAAAVFADMLNKPDQYHFKNVKDACYSGSYMPEEGGTECANPNEYIFWDTLHPTTAAHCFMAQTALKALEQNGLLDARATASFSCSP